VEPDIDTAVMMCCCRCTSCASSSWGCTWCIGLNRCLQPADVHHCSDNAVTDKQVNTHLPGTAAAAA